MKRIHEHEAVLGKYLYERLASIDGLTLYGPTIDSPFGHTRTGLVAFNHKSIHPTDLSFFLDQEGVAVRTGFIAVYMNSLDDRLISIFA